MNERWVCLVLTAVVLGACAEEPERAIVDWRDLPLVVARVEGQSITREQLGRRVSAEKGEEALLEDYREVLDQLIGSELLYQEALARGYGLQEEELDARLAAIRSRFDSEEAYLASLSEPGLTPADVRRALGRDLAVKRYLEAEVIGEVSVTEEQAREYFEEHQEEIRADRDVRARHILIPLDGTVPAPLRLAAREKLEGIRRQVLEGADFAELARQHSGDPGSAPLGGELGWISRGNTVPAFEEAAFRLEIGETSEIVESAFGLHLIQVTEERPGRPVSWEEARDQLLAFLREQKVAELIGEKAAELRGQAKVEISI